MPCDYSEYPANWDEIREKIRARSRDCCEWCGERNGTLVIRAWRRGAGTTKIVLTVAHLDHDKANNDGMDQGGPALPLEQANLVHLCQKCHLGHDKERHMRTRADNRDKRTGQMRIPVVEDVW